MSVSDEIIDDMWQFSAKDWGGLPLDMIYKNVIFISWLLEAGCLWPYGGRTRSQCNVPYITIHGMFSCYIDKAGRDHPERDEVNEVVTLLDNTFTLRFLFYQLSIPCNINILSQNICPSIGLTLLCRSHGSS